MASDLMRIGKLFIGKHKNTEEVLFVRSDLTYD